ncbi:MAG: hypothetical protein BRC41_19470 [Cyanobacteria bacterium QH_9_48_43]|nr:MAG: hypothetical protein BRC41_19470 [Cyanobacteria bacterium QH_9_48_43]
MPYSSAKTPSSASQWEDLSLERSPDEAQWDKIKSHLTLALLSLEALAEVGAEAMLAAAAELDLDSVVAEKIELWRRGESQQKTLDVEQARAIVLIICHLAHQHQELIRLSVSLLEETVEQNQPPHPYSPEQRNGLAFKLLIDLVFYSSTNSHLRLWRTLFES